MSGPVFPRGERAFLLTLASIQFGHILDFMIVMPLGPILIAEFGIDAHQFGLLVAAYSFGATGAGLAATTFVDRYERKRLLLTVFTLFALATLACGLAPGFHVLLAARALAGAFGGVLGALVHTLIGDTIPFERRARASGLVSAAFSVATIAGVPSALWLANHYGWRAPFLGLAGLCLLCLAAGARALPRHSAHLAHPAARHPFAALGEVLRVANHRRALFFSALVIFAGFTVIPYLTLFGVANVGLAQTDIPLIYLVGGSATLITARLIGRWADRYGKIRVFRIVAGLALIPLTLVTNAGPTPLPLWIAITTVFFVLVSGRMIPAMAIVTSAAVPARRGTFMSLNGTVQSLAMGAAASLAGAIVTVGADGRLGGYAWVGLIAIGANLGAIAFAGRIALNPQRPL